MITFRTDNGRFFAERDHDGIVRLGIEGCLEGSCSAGTMIRFVAKLTQAQLEAVLIECAPGNPDHGGMTSKPEGM